MAKKNNMEIDNFFDISSFNSSKKDSNENTIENEPKKEVKEKKIIEKKENKKNEAKDKDNEVVKTDLIEYFRKNADIGNTHRTSVNISPMQHEILMATAIVLGISSEGASGIIRNSLREYMEKTLSDEDVKNKVIQFLQLKGIM